MEKRMEPLSVSTRGGQIWIEQEVVGEEHGVAIYPDQIPVLIEWLNEAAAEIAAETKARAGSSAGVPVTTRDDNATEQNPR